MKKASRNKKQDKKVTRKFQILGLNHFITDFKNLPRWAQVLFVTEVVVIQLFLIVTLILLIL